jgi:hypothetical protein
MIFIQVRGGHVSSNGYVWVIAEHLRVLTIYTAQVGL